MMKRIVLVGIIIAAIAGGAMLQAQSGRSAEVQMKAAQQKAEVQGDLKGAIEDYKRIVASAGANRALAGQALVRMAECYQMLGDSEARRIYQQLVRDYADQPNIHSVARARLGEPARAPLGSGDRSVWISPDADGFGTISRDGRFLTYTDWRHGARVVLRDLSTGSDRPLTDEAEGGSQFSVLSKNGKEVVYQWYPRGTTGVSELRIMSVHDTTKSQRLFANAEVDLAPFDWSSDGKWIAVLASRKDRTTQIGLLSAQDGSLRILRSTDWKEPTKIFFSPDSRFVAYDLPVSETNLDRHIYVMAADGSTESEVVPHASVNVIMGWSSDGQHMLFTSDRGGNQALWAVRVSGGKAQGSAFLVQGNVGSSWAMGVSDTDTMFVWRDRAGMSVQIAGFDAATGTLLPASSTTHEQFIRSRGRPEWSPDGRFIAYESCNGLGGGPCTIHIWDVEKGDARTLRTRVKYAQAFRWSPDGRRLLTMGSDFKGRQGLYQIDVMTGDASAILPADDNRRPGAADWSADGKSILYRQRAPGGSLILVRRDLASGEEREVFRTPAEAYVLSPDRQLVAYTRRTGTSRGVFVAPIAGGEATRVFADESDVVHRISWTPDGKSVLITKINEGVPAELWLSPINGGAPKRLDVNIRNWTIDGPGQISPDGKHIAFVHVAGKPAYEIWALGNYAAALKSR